MQALLDAEEAARVARHTPRFPCPHLPGSSGGGTQRSLHRAFSPTAGPVGPEPLTSPLFRCAGRLRCLGSNQRLKVSRRFPLAPLQNYLFTPGLQWQCRGLSLHPVPL